jgi:hypothetical protein
MHREFRKAFRFAARRSTSECLRCLACLGTIISLSVVSFAQVDRSDLSGAVTGGRSVAEWINPAAFAFPAAPSGFGTAPRDLVAGPGTWQVDLSADKTFSLTERSQLQFRSEFYNVFNHPQLGAPNATCNNLIAPGTIGCGSVFANITSTVNTAVSPVTPVGSGTPREVQFALRLEF